MNHGIARGISLMLKDGRVASTKEIIAIISRYHRRFCQCYLRHSLTANIQSVLAQEVSKERPRWQRVGKGLYQVR